MSSAFEAPRGPAASVPPPPPPSGSVPPPPPTSAPPRATPPPPTTQAPDPPAPEPPSPVPAAPPTSSTPPPPPSTPPPPPSTSPSSPPQTPPTPAPAPAPAPSPEPASAEEPGPAVERHDLSDILEQLHDDLHVDAAPAPTAPEAPLTDPRDLERPVTETIVIESTGGLEFRPDFASFGARLLGALVDGLVLSLAMVPGIVLTIQSSDGVMTALGLFLSFIGYVGTNVWYARSIARTGQWIGNRVAKTKVVDAMNGSNIDAFNAAARFAARHLISVIFLFGFFAALADSQRRAFHDRIAGTVVTGRPRATWSAGDDDT